MQRRGWMAAAVAFAAIALTAASAGAHWCSNIFSAHARLVVKPEKTTLNVPASGSAQLKVFVQNNFPYRTNIRLRGAASGYSINTSPYQQKVYPGQQVAFTMTISGKSGSVTAKTLNIQVRMRVGSWGGSDKLIDNQTQSTMTSSSKYNSSYANQAPSFYAAALADNYPSAKIGSQQGRTGMEQLITWFGYRFCYSSSGNYRCGSQGCPSPCKEGSPWTSTQQFPQNCMRAGVDVGVRKTKLGSLLGSARNGAVNAMKAGSGEHKCLAAVVGGHLWRGASNTSAFENALNNVSSRCKAAGLRAVGKGSPSSCGSGSYYERAACAAAEGLRGNDGPVKSVLMTKAGDSGSYSTLYYAYMLHLVSGARLAQGKQPSYYPKVGPDPDSGVTPSKDKGTTPGKDQGGVPGSDGTTPAADQGGAAGDPVSPRTEEGCAMGRAPAAPSAGLLLLAGLVALAGLGRARRRG